MKIKTKFKSYVHLGIQEDVKRHEKPKVIPQKQEKKNECNENMFIYEKCMNFDCECVMGM